ncbi:unnamed protein product [Mucor fragilis]
MSSSQNANDTSVASIDITSDYIVQLDQLLPEAQLGLDRLSHNVARFNDSLQTIAAVGDQFTRPSYLWVSFNMSIKTNTSNEVKYDEEGKNTYIDHLDFEASMLEKEPEEDGKRENEQQRFVHNTMNETVVLDNLSYDGD